MAQVLVKSTDKASSILIRSNFVSWTIVMKQDVFHKMFQYIFSPNYTSSIKKKKKASPLH